jgi:hypothetical protein
MSTPLVLLPSCSRVRATVLALAAAMLLAAPAAGVASSPGPVVRIADRHPLTLSGLRFKSNERVVLYVSLRERTLVEKVRASAGGSFRAVFATSYDRCDTTLGLNAIGARGSRVAWKLASLDCPIRDGVARDR